MASTLPRVCFIQQQSKPQNEKNDCHYHLAHVCVSVSSGKVTWKEKTSSTSALNLYLRAWVNLLSYIQPLKRTHTQRSRI